MLFFFIIYTLNILWEFFIQVVRKIKDYFDTVLFTKMQISVFLVRQLYLKKNSKGINSKVHL